MARWGRERRGSTSQLVTESLPFRFLLKKPYFFVAQMLEYLGATAPLRTVYFAFSRLELACFILKTLSHLFVEKLGTLRRKNESLPLRQFSYEKALVLVGLICFCARRKAALVA